MSSKKIALVTGATSGIGKELAKCFVINGYNLVIVARDEKALRATADEFRKQYGSEIAIIQADLSLPGAAEKVYAALNGKALDVLVNNAGFAEYGPFAESNIEKIIASMRLNMETMTHLTRLVLPDMIDRRCGRILNVASTAAFQPGPLMAVYYATKAYVLSFSEAVRYELRGTGVSITTLCPGPTETNFQKISAYGKTRIVKAGLMRADDVARQGYLGLIDNVPIVVPGMKNKIGAFLIRFAPRALVLKIIYKAQQISK